MVSAGQPWEWPFSLPTSAHIRIVALVTSEAAPQTSEMLGYQCRVGSGVDLVKRPRYCGTEIC
jgi:hypothetical protein